MRDAFLGRARNPAAYLRTRAHAGTEVVGRNVRVAFRRPHPKTAEFLAFRPAPRKILVARASPRFMELLRDEGEEAAIYRVHSAKI